MKYVNYNETNGKILGWYDRDIHCERIVKKSTKKGVEDTITFDTSKIPTPFKEIKNDVWQLAIDNNHNFIDLEKMTTGKKDFRNLEELKLSKINSLNKKAKDLIVSGFSSPALGDNYYYQSSRDDQANLLSDVLSDIDLELKCSSDNINFTFVEHTALQIKQVSDAFTLHRLDALKKVDILKTSVENASSEDDLDKIVW